MTPAMAQGVTNEPWELEQFYEALIAAEPVSAPVAVPLIERKPATPSRPLPTGGFLRVVPPLYTNPPVQPLPGDDEVEAAPDTERSIQDPDPEDVS